MICEGSDASCNWNSNSSREVLLTGITPKLFYFNNKVQGFGMFIIHA